MSSRNKTDDFIGLCKDWEESFKKCFISVFATKVNDSWVLRYGTIILSQEHRLDKIDNFCIKTENLIAYKTTRNVDVDELVSSISRSCFKFNDFGEDVVFSSKENFDYYYHPEHHPDYPNYERVPTLQVTDREYNSSNVELNFYDEELRVSDRPYDGLDDLLSEMGIPNKYKYEHENRLDISVKTPVYLEESSKFNKDLISISLISDLTINVDKIKVGLKILKNDEKYDRVSIYGNEIAWKKKDKYNIGKVNYPVINATATQIFVSYLNKPLLRWWITDEEKSLNYRVSIHKTFDTDFSKLEKLLYPNKNASRNFEKGIAILLYLHGFYIAQYGEKEIVQEGPDLLAELPNGDILVVECTTGVSDISSKLSKLVERTQRIRLSVANSVNSGAQVVPVLMTNLEEVQINPYTDQFRKFKSSYTTKVDIKDFMQRLDYPMRPSELYDEIKSIIKEESNNIE